MKRFSSVLLKVFRWQIFVENKYKTDKAIIIMAPHTSMMDFCIGRLAFWKHGFPVVFIIKKELFWFPLGIILKAMGATPINRKKSRNILVFMNNLFESNSKINLIITPEGTREHVAKWKRGFYEVALKQKIPIMLAYIDYKKKEGGIGKELMPTGNYENDLSIIRDFYKNISAKHPEKFNPDFK